MFSDYPCFWHIIYAHSSKWYKWNYLQLYSPSVFLSGFQQLMQIPEKEIFKFPGFVYFLSSDAFMNSYHLVPWHSLSETFVHQLYKCRDE